ncbi:MAG: hypothetical protein EG822_13400 [Deltaproteobacteria bacterium]|nr:hypothetical protein [Deltaproteobacteria bacterium]TLN01443.1 MAG: hypothetical protein FDZ73_15785 [bacterium]
MTNATDQLDDQVNDPKEAKKEVIRKISVDPELILKMKRLSSLYADEIPDGAKEIDIISFFFNKSFNLFLKSGEIDRKVEEIKTM